MQSILNRPANRFALYLAAFFLTVSALGIHLAYWGGYSYAMTYLSDKADFNSRLVFYFFLIVLFDFAVIWLNFIQPKLNKEHFITPLAETILVSMAAFMPFFMLLSIQ